MRTQSGYEVIPKYGDPRIQLLTVGGVDIAPGVLRGDVHTIMGWVAQQFNDTVEHLIPGQCFSFAPRQIVGGSGWSNHASATAMDLNGTEYPQGTYRMTAHQVAACMAISVICGGVIRWGGTYTYPTLVDQQHWEMGDDTAGTVAVSNLARKIRSGGMISVSDILQEKITVSDPFKNPTSKTVTMERMFQDMYNSARCAHRDTQQIIAMLRASGNK